MWVIRNNGGEYVEEFLAQRIAAIGWQKAGPLYDLKLREQVIARVQETWPEWNPSKAMVSGGQLFRIAHVIKPGDRVATYDPSQRIYHVGRIVGDYQFDANAEDILANRRSVQWDGVVKRDDLTLQTKRSLGSSLSLFEVSDDAEAEFEKLLSGAAASFTESQQIAAPEAIATTQYILNDLRAQAKEFIKDKVVSLDWDEMQELVAGLLRAMGYKTRVSPQGPDRGVDIIASPDGFGFEQPRIVVEVKHRPQTQMRSPEIRSFLGGRHPSDKGLYVSTGGFSKDAKYEADRASIPLTLMDIDELVDTFVSYYEQLDLATRTLVPLTRIYWPSES